MAKMLLEPASSCDDAVWLSLTSMSAKDIWPLTDSLEFADVRLAETDPVTTSEDAIENVGVWLWRDESVSNVLRLPWR
jgi:hypothetical protein